MPLRTDGNRTRSKLVPESTDSQYGVINSNDATGGPFSYDTIEERDAIKPGLLTIGATCYVAETGITYIVTDGDVTEDGGIENPVWEDTQTELKAALVKTQPLKLTRLKNAIAGYRFEGSGFASLLFLGDSIGLSFWDVPIILELARRYGLRGFWTDLGVTTLGTASATFAGGSSSGTTETTDAYDVTPCGRTFIMTGAGQGVQFFPTSGNIPDFTANKYTLVYARRSGGGIFKVETLSGAGGDTDEYWQPVAGMEAIDTNNPTTQLATLAVPFAAASATNRVRCMWVSGGGTQIVGALVENTAVAGLIISFFTKAGLDMGNHISQITAPNLAVILNLVKPDLIHWAFKDDNIAAKIAANQILWDTAYPTEWVFPTPYPSQSQTPEAARAHCDIIINHAKANGKEWWDILLHIPSFQYGNDRGWYGDDTHTNAKATYAVGPPLWRDTGLIPDAREGAVPYAEQRIQTLRAESDVLIGGRSQVAANAELSNLTRIENGGVRVLVGTNGKVSATIPAVGLSSYTCWTYVLVPDSPVTLELLGLKTSNNGGNQNSTVHLIADATPRFRITVRTSGGNNVVFGTSTMANYFWSLRGQVVAVGFCRDVDAPAGRTKMSIIINGRVFPANGTDAGAMESLASTLFIVGEVSSSATQTNYFYGGACLYMRRLTDDEILTAIRSGRKPSGALIDWDFAYSGQATVRDYSLNPLHGTLLSSAVFTKPREASSGGGGGTDYTPQIEGAINVARGRLGGISIPSGTPSRVAKTGLTAIADESFTILYLVRVPSTQAVFDVGGLRTSTIPGSSQPGSVLLGVGPTSTGFRASIQDSGGTSYNFGNTTLGTAFWGASMADAGKIKLVGVRRNKLGATGQIVHVIVGSLISAQAGGGDAVALSSLAATVFVAGASGGNPSVASELYGAYYFNRALSDAEIAAINGSGIFPSDPVVAWDMIYSLGTENKVRDFSGNNYHGDMLGTSAWAKARPPFIRRITSATSPAIQAMLPNARYVADATNSDPHVFLLPAPADSRAGDVSEIKGHATGKFSITQAAGQLIRDPTGTMTFDSVTGPAWSLATTTTGTAGSLTAVHKDCSITIECVSDDGLQWLVTQKNGPFTYA